MYVYEVIAKGLVKGNTIEEYQIGDRIESEKPINSGRWLSRLRLVSSPDQPEPQKNAGKDPEQEPEKELVNQLEVETPDKAEPLEDHISQAEVATKDELVKMNRELNLGIKSAHLMGVDKLRHAVIEAL